MATELAKAYVQIIPTAEGIKGKLSEALGGEADAAGKSAGGKFGNAFGSVMGGVAKAGVAGMAAAGTAVAALAKEAVNSYADYEQLVGGVETLFKDSAGTVQQYAAEAFQSAGISANEYMSTVTSFSASLLQSLGGDTAQAASVADMAIRDMSDNANKMGTDMSAIQTAYQGFAKQNYTMLDNLKLGYGGTKSEMERLLADATALSGVEYDINSLNDVYEAIHVIQTELDITGTTAKEASSTISGSLGSMKAAWQNLITGVADENADMNRLVDDFAKSAFTVADNLVPRVEKALQGTGKLVTGLAPVITKAVPGLIRDVLPTFTKAGVQLIETLVTGMGKEGRLIGDTAVEIASTLIRGLGKAAPAVLKSGTKLILDLALSLTDPVNIHELMNAAVDLAVGLGEGLVEAIPEICTAVPVILYNLAAAIIEAAPRLLYEVPFKIGETIGNGLRNLDWKDVGQKLLGGLKDSATNFMNILTGAAEPATEAVTEIGEAAEVTRERLGAVVSSGTIGRLRALQKETKKVTDYTIKWNGETQEVGEVIAWTDDVLDDSLKTVKIATEDYKKLDKKITVTTEQFKAMRDRISEYTKDLNERYRDNYEAAYDSMQGQVDLYDGLKEAAEVTVASVIENLKKQTAASRDYYDNLKTVMDGAREHGIQISAELQAELQSGSDNAKLIVQELADSMEAGNQEMLADLNSAMNERHQVSVEFARLCAGDAEEVKKNAALMRHEMLELVRSTDGLYNDFHNAGLHAAQGLLDGWNSLSANVTAAVGSTTNSMVRRAHSILQEQSPSKVFRQIGAYAIEGMTLGLLDEAPDAIDVMGDISSDLIRAAAYDARSAMTYQSIKKAASVPAKLPNMPYIPAYDLRAMPASPYAGADIRTIQTEISATLQALRGMHVVLSTGETVGALTVPLNDSLGNQYSYSKRGI